MKKNNLIYEISRIKELMSINIISENLLPLTHLIRKVDIDKFMSISGKRIKNKEVFDELVEKLGKSIDNNDDVLFISTLKEMGKESTAFYDEVLEPNVINSLGDVEKQYFKEYYDHIWDIYKNGKINYKEALQAIDDFTKKRNLGDFDYVVSNFYKKKLTSEVDNLPGVKSGVKKIGKEMGQAFYHEFITNFWSSDSVYGQAVKYLIKKASFGTLGRTFLMDTRKEFWIKTVNWLLTGSTKGLISELALVFRGKKGLHIVLTDYTAAFLKRYIKVLGAFAIIRTLRNFYNDNPELASNQEASSDFSEAIFSNLPSMGWALPFTYVLDTLRELYGWKGDHLAFFDNIDEFYDKLSVSESEFWTQLVTATEEQWKNDLKTITGESLDYDADVLEKRLSNTFGKWQISFKGSSGIDYGIGTFNDQMKVTLPGGESRIFNVDNLTAGRDDREAKRMIEFLNMVKNPNSTNPQPQPQPTQPQPQPQPTQPTQPTQPQPTQPYQPKRGGGDY